MKLYDEQNNRWIDHRQTQEYGQRKWILRDVWIVGLFLSLALPTGLQLAAILFGLCLSFCFLDETPYKTP